jgi:hypothetical protein
MSVPGSNNLALALTVIGSTPVNYFQFLSSTAGPTGLATSAYAAPFTVLRGSFQPVDRSRFERFGLDYEKSYAFWYVPNVAASAVQRNPDNSGDVIEAPVNRDGSAIAGVTRRYQLMSGTNWLAIDRWMSLLAVDIGPATGALTNA